MFAAAFAAAVAIAGPASAQTRDEWISLGTRIHGGFGVLIPIGLRIGLDAKAWLSPEPRGLTIVYYAGEKAPCPCIADGLMIATQTSPGQGTLKVADERAPHGFYAVAVVRNRKTGQALRYTISDAWIPKIAAWNRELGPAGRYDAAMAAEGLFRVEPTSE